MSDDYAQGWADGEGDTYNDVREAEELAEKYRAAWEADHTALEEAVARLEAVLHSTNINVASPEAATIRNAARAWLSTYRSETRDGS